MSHRAFSDDDRAFIRAILTNPAEVSGWLVYADWLDEHEQPERAEFLRLQVERSQLPDDERTNTSLVAVVFGNMLRNQVPPDDERRKAIDARMSELRELVHRGWAAVFDRPMIENCDEHFAFECPLKWENLQLTANHKVRHCDACDKDVYYCNTVDEARTHASEGQCVTVPLGVLRYPGDLDPFAHVTGMMTPTPAWVYERLERGEPLFPPPDETEPWLQELLPEPEPSPAPRRPWWKFW